MKRLIIAALATTVLGGAASAQGLPDGKGNSAGGYNGDMERRLGTDSRGPTGPAGSRLRADPRLADGKGNQAGGYRGYVDRRLGTDRTGTVRPAGGMMRADPRLADGKGNQAGGYRGYQERRSGVGGYGY